ncbi:DNA polymerase III subunits gamma and tau [Entomoplasma ellychniae]|uniref:DNA polymerase III subunit gamma/tau n=1 Tax=Entomoplasma ellychniae TaxID=2114 RepID=A0A8E2QZ03_9MOLU|nr:DNA polymerase III subunit gamma/tau [Entomoplasma ellychniae]PPE04793.1 DNA polymerase III subunits gamma and tau [Entomoplasma ellychniae]
MNNNTTIYRKYRPSNFNSVAGHKNVVEILKKQLQTNKIAQSFLFAGQRGTGKTSIARILAKSVNCENLIEGLSCETCKNCVSSNEQKNPDIIEMDAASNNGVDEIRDIKNNVSTLPLIGKYKVYIIDEVHMLTKAAFNALLKTLEEPPKHAIFILATTEYSRIPATIISRCQIFNFKKIDKSAIKARVKFIIDNEGFKVEEEVLTEIAILCDGSLRDASNIIEQLINISSIQISMNDLKSIFYVAPKQEKIELILNIIQNNPQNIIKYFEDADNQGMDFDVLTLSLIEILKEIIEFKFLKLESYLSVLDQEDLNNFNEVEIKELFKIADNLSEVYAKTKGTNINFNYLLISILKLLDKSIGFTIKDEIVNKNIANHKINSLVFKPSEAEETIQTTKPLTYAASKDFMSEFNEKAKEEIKQEEIKNVEHNLFSNQNQTNKTLEFTFNKSEEIMETNKQEKISQEIIVDQKQVLFETVDSIIFDVKQKIFENENKKSFLVSIIEVINLLLKANKDTREENQIILGNIFNVDHEGKFVNKELANELSPLIGFKIIASSENQILLRHDNFKNVKYLCYSLLEESFLEKIKTIFKGRIIIPISETLWNDIKIEYKQLKENNTLPEYIPRSFNEYYEEKRKSLLSSSVDEKTLKAASELFNIEDMEVE